MHVWSRRGEEGEEYGPRSDWRWECNYGEGDDGGTCASSLPFQPTLSTNNPISIRPLPNWPPSKLFQPQVLQQTAVCAVEPRAFTRVRPCLPCNTAPNASAHHDDVVCVGVHMTIFQTGTCMQRARHTYRSYACCDSLMRIFHETHPAHPDSVPTPKQTR
jgi:hypothetical protein